MSTTKSLKYYPWVNREMMSDIKRKKRIKLERDSPRTRESFPTASFLSLCPPPLGKHSYLSFYSSPSCFSLLPGKSAPVPLFPTSASLGASPITMAMVLQSQVSPVGNFLEAGSSMRYSPKVAWKKLIVKWGVTVVYVKLSIFLKV